MREACGRCRDCGKRPGRAKHAREDRGVAFPTVAWKTLRVSHKRPPDPLDLYREKLRGKRKIFLAEEGFMSGGCGKRLQTPAASETERSGFPLPSDDDGVSHSLQKHHSVSDEGGAFRKTRSSIPLAVDARRPDPASKETNAVLHLGRFW